MTPHKVPYINGCQIVVVPTSKTVTNIEDLNFFYGVIKGIPNCTMLDIGANKGYYALLTTQKPDLSFLSFEPHPHVFRNFLLRNLSLNQVTHRGQAFNHGFSSKNSNELLYYDNSENSSLKKDVEREQEIVHAVVKNPKRAGFLRYSHVLASFRRLDDTQSLDRPIDVIKLDAEGAESWIIDGGMEFFAKTKALLFIEIEERHCLRFGTTVDSVLDKLRSVGYVQFEKVRNNFLCSK